MTLEEQFHELADVWRVQTSYLSNMTAHPNYQKIVDLGPDVVPWIIRELKREPDHWFHALKAITGVDPVLRADRGDIAKMREAWLKWYDTEDAT